VPVCDIEHTKILGYEAEKTWELPLHGFVELILSRYQRLAHGPSREAEDCIMTAYLIGEWLKLDDRRSWRWTDWRRRNPSLTGRQRIRLRVRLSRCWYSDRGRASASASALRVIEGLRLIEAFFSLTQTTLIIHGGGLGHIVVTFPVSGLGLVLIVFELDVVHETL
jgi:hypothetical protein